MWDLLLTLFGFLVGIIASLTGIGGGSFIVPILAILYNFVPANAVGTSLTSIIFTAAASTVNYARQKRIYYKTGLILAVTTAPGAFLGARLTSIIAPNTLGLIFGFFIIFIALRMIININDFRSKKANLEEGKVQLILKSDKEVIGSGRNLFLGTGLSFFGGLASGLLGIGGGVLVVPIMVFALKMPIHNATATSMFTMIITSISGVAEHYMANHIYLDYVLLLALGTIFGAQVGAYASKRISGKGLRRIFGLVLLFVSIQMILKYLPS
ncbi:MAG: sulfite exporter TauE/SafE family protein [Candidatus Bathyarchaeota archaeon]|nr:MAG: sulfite exporter TauE/SafE family protein [Candidatus Bathyarchaeota archaeon]